MEECNPEGQCIYKTGAVIVDISYACGGDSVTLKMLGLRNPAKKMI